ncbi:MAG TPA: GNAT family N-acetyltransferase [Chloroflexota bacterium]|nr:GNAT family N-acetyltransferase [Chloroflexota bacterium]
MTATETQYEIHPLGVVPERVRGVRQELNHLWYGPSEVLVARAPGAPDDQVAGAVRLAMRERPARPHGLVTDLVVEQELRETGLPEQLLAAAEERLKQRGAQKLDAVAVDGLGWASYYYRRGFWSSRRMVVLTWDLADRNTVERSPDFRIERVDRPDPEATARFILNSYQPYFRWWKEAREDQKWDRVELQADEAVDKYQQAAHEIQQRAVDLVAAAGRDCPQTYFLAYQGDALVGLCDAKDAPEGQDTFDWCVLVSRSFTGKALGSTLLDHALEWFAARGRKTAEYTATSGLDDYDPIIYLSTVVTGAQIRGEFLNLVKNRL